MKNMLNSPTKKAVLLASASPVALAFTGDAKAAPPPVPQPPAANTIPVYSWTGCYVGVNGGYGWGRQHVSTSGSQTKVIPGCSGGSTTTTSGSASSGLDSSGGLFGGQVVCDFQFAPNLVVGVAGMLDSANMHGTTYDPWNAFNGGMGTISLTTTELASTVGRVGFTVWNNTVLFYVQGGAAWDQNRWNLTNTELVFSPQIVIDNRFGWTGGGGVTWAFTPVWSVFAEFNYYDFSSTYTVATAGNVFSAGRQTIEVFMMGVSYKLGPYRP